MLNRSTLNIRHTRPSTLNRLRVIWCQVLSLCILCGCSGAEKAAKPEQRSIPVKLKRTRTEDVATKIVLVGRMDSRKSVDLFPRVDGYVAKIAIDPGQLVKARQLLIEIDSNKQMAAVAAKQSSVELAKADLAKEVGRLGSLEADIEARQSMVDFNDLEYQRYYWLEKRGVVATAAVDKENRDLRVAKSRRNALDAEIKAQHDVIERARKRIDEAEAELQAEKEELAYHLLRAPFSGVIGDVPVKLGDYVNPQTKLTKLSLTKPLEVNVEVPQDQAKLVSVGTSMKILDDAGERVGSSTVSYVSPTVNLQNQSVLIKGNFPNEGKELRPDQSVQVELILKSEPSVLVPTEAITFVAGKPFIFIAEKNPEGKLVAKQRPIDISQIQNNAATVSSGLKPGESIVVSGIQLLQDNTPIEESGSK